MGKAKTPSFVTELPLKVGPAQERALLVRLDCARQVYNACLGESLKRLKLLRESKAYRAARWLSKGPKGSPQAEARSRAFRRARAAVGFREYDLHAYAAQFNHCWIGAHLDINTIQKLATRAFDAVDDYALGKHGKPRYRVMLIDNQQTCRECQRGIVADKTLKLFLYSQCQVKNLVPCPYHEQVITTGKYRIDVILELVFLKNRVHIALEKPLQ